MLLPKTLKMGVHTFKIIYPYVFDNSTITGLCCLETKEIKIKRVTQTGEVQSETNRLTCFFHEIIHVIDDLYCMGLIGKECVKEDLIDALSEGVVQVLKENPQLLDVLKQ